MRSAGWAFVGVGFVLVGAITLFALHPVPKADLKGATSGQIRAVLPADLLQTTPVDPAATARFGKLSGLLKEIDVRKYEAALDPKARAAVVGKLAADFKSEYATTLAGMDSVLAAGPIQLPSKSVDGLQIFTGMMNVKADIKYLAIFGKSLADSGDTRTGADMLISAIKISDAFLHSKGDLITYLTSVALEAICFKGVQDAVANAHFPADQCARLLTTIAASPSGDEDLRLALRTEFQDVMLTKIGDAGYMAQLARAIGDSTFRGENAKDPPIGTYDAVSTSRTFGLLYEEALANTGKPYDAIDHKELDLVHKDAAGLPRQVDDSVTRDEGDNSGYRQAMATGKNTIGRLILAATAKDANVNAASCRLRADRDCTRIDLAATIYRSSHGGALPAAKEALVPLLGAWPYDPFNGKPMTYNAEKEIAYSVGRNLKDDGGNFAATKTQPLDIGVSLKRN